MDNFITKQEKEDLENELQELKEVKRPKAIERLQVARSYGDLSENTEYETAREQQRVIESRINEIETVLKNSAVMKETTKHERVTTGQSVTVKADGEKKTFDIGKENGNISVSPHSPIAEALMGKKAGDTVTVTIPKGTIEIEILKIF